MPYVPRARIRRERRLRTSSFPAVFPSWSIVGTYSKVKGGRKEPLGFRFSTAVNLLCINLESRLRILCRMKKELMKFGLLMLLDCHENILAPRLSHRCLFFDVLSFQSALDLKAAGNESNLQPLCF